MQNAVGFKRKWVWLVVLLAMVAVFFAGLRIGSSRSNPYPGVLKTLVPIGSTGAIYVFRWDKGGATAPNLYRYYFLAKTSNAGEALKLARAATPFLVTDDADSKILASADSAQITTDARIYEFASKAGFNNGDDYISATFYLSNFLHRP